jgi:CDP-glucose 4,6-dehydratase
VQWVAETLARLWPGGIPLDSAGAEPLRGPEAATLRVDSSRARVRLAWRPRWGLGEALERTVSWYRALQEGTDMRATTLEQIEEYAA